MPATSRQSIVEVLTYLLTFIAVVVLDYRLVPPPLVVPMATTFEKKKRKNKLKISLLFFN